MYYIGIDLGGTNIKGALVSETGEITREVSRPTRVGLGAEAVCDGIAAVITELSSGVDRTSLGGVGLGCPGTVDDETGRVLYANNLRRAQVKVLPAEVVRIEHAPGNGGRRDRPRALCEQPRLEEL